MGLPYEGAGEQVLRLRLTEQVLKDAPPAERTIVVIDEAHHLAADLLEELRLLGNLEAGADKAFQAVCLAQPAILETLKTPLSSAGSSVWPCTPSRTAERRRGLRLLAASPAARGRQTGPDHRRVRHGGHRAAPRHSAAAEPRRAAALVLADAAELEIVDAEAALWRWPPPACKWRRRTTSKKPRWWHERGIELSFCPA